MNSKAPDRQPHVPTLADVARHAGVSTATVSRCLNTPDQVVEKTRTRVLAAVRELGYSPNFGARVLAAKRTNTIGAIIPTMENAIFARGLQAFQEELGEHGVTMLVASSSYRQDIEEEQIRTLVARGADALLLIGHDRSPGAYEFLNRRRVPHLSAWVYNVTSPRLSIGFDNHAAMFALTNAVLDQGHRRIAVISAPRASNDRARERVEGILAAIAGAGLDPEGIPIVETPYAFETGAEAFREVMACRPTPTAVMCVNDVLAVGAIDMARKLDLRVPRDVSITGFDDIEIAQIVSPKLTTVHVPHRQMGRLAAKLLVGMINGAGPSKSVNLPTDIRFRETLGPAAL